MIYRYVDMDSRVIFVKNLVSEAPLQEVSGVPMPTLEKLLVDILRDTDFFYLQGSESDRIIENAFNLYTINRNRLFRYADRRKSEERIIVDFRKLKHTMIKKECFTTEWIEQVASELHYNDKNLIEKVIRALSLLEMLVKAGCPLVFKGGTALMLILGKSAHRLSIDIDVICPPGTNIEDYLKSFADFGFINLELVERKQRDDADIPKSHSKFFYQIAYRNDTDAQSYILLDVLYEDIHYFQTRQIAIDCRSYGWRENH